MRPIAALVQARARGVQGQGRHIPQQAHADGVSRACLLEPVGVIRVFEPLHHRFFGDGLDGAKTAQLRLDSLAQHRELPVAGDPVFPGQGPNALEKLVEGAGLEFPHLQQHPVGAAQPQIGAGDVGQLGVELDAALCHPDGFKSQGFDLVFDDLFQTEGGGGDKRKGCHGSSLP